MALKRERDKLMHQLKQHVSTASQCRGDFSLHFRWILSSFRSNSENAFVFSTKNTLSQGWRRDYYYSKILFEK